MNPTLIVFKKELRDMFRDKRVRTSAFVMPMVLIIGMLYLFGFLFTSLEKKENVKVHVIKSSSAIVDQLRKEKVNVVFVESAEEGKRQIRNGDARLVLDFGPEPKSLDQKMTIKAYFDPKNQLGTVAMSHLQPIFQELNKARVAAFLKANNLPPDAQELVKLEKEEVNVGEKGGAGQFLVGFLPYLIVVWAFWGGMGIVSDLVAGEKEKNTLETLLITPVRRTQIVLGKFFALCVVCLLSSLSSILGLYVFALLKPAGAEAILKEGIGVSGTAFGTILLVLLPTVAFFAGLLLAISSYAKNTREAQTHLAVVSFIVLMPAIFVQMIGLTGMARAMWINYIPVLNSGANIRAALLGQAEAVPVLLTVATSLLLAMLALKIAVTLFNREQVLTRV